VANSIAFIEETRMLLGDLMARFDDEAVAAEALISLDDLGLTVRVQEAAAREGLTAGEFASAAVQHFSRAASDEEWVTTIGQIGRSQEPGLVLLRRSLAWMLTSHAASRSGS
jgi:hypothetical protein